MTSPAYGAVRSVDRDQEAAPRRAWHLPALTLGNRLMPPGFAVCLYCHRLITRYDLVEQACEGKGNVE
jgi:hypothetical protein